MNDYKQCDYCIHVEMCGWRKDVEEQGCEFYDDANKWIPCSERLPEVHTDVLATTVWGDITIAERLDDSSWFISEGYSNANDEDIVAWQELPEPFREGESE